MYLSSGVVLLFCGAFQVAWTDDTYIYTNKLTEHYANVMIRMDHGMHKMVEEMERALEERCPFNRVTSDYRMYIDRAAPFNRVCPTSEDRANLKTMKVEFQKSREECLAKAECETELAATTDKIVNTIQEFDAQAFKDTSACNGEETCIHKVERTLQDNLAKLFQDSYPRMRVVADKSFANTKCHSAMLQCMIDNNTDRMVKLYSGIAKLQDCMSNAVSSRAVYY